jgi:predicted Zn-dependent peptidase
MPKSARLALAALALSLALGIAAAPVARARVEDPALRTRVTTLDNGLTILTLPDPTTPAVSFQMWVKVGSRDEARYTGLAHLFEHMMFRGTDRLPPESHERLIEGRGGRVNAFTTADHTVYHAVVAPDSLPLVIELEAERLAHLHIDEDTLASERQVVLEERRERTEDQPTGRVFEALLSLTFMAHPYRVPVIGWRSDIEQVSVEACREFFDTYYAPNNIVVSISGAFDEQDALARVRRAFGGLEAAKTIPRNPTQEPPQTGERRATVYFDVRSPILAATWHAPKSGHPDGEALDVASLVLSGGRSSRLYRGLVYEAQQALAAEGGYWELDHAGIFYAFAMVRPDGDIARVEQLFLREIERLREELVPETELAKARRQIEVSLLRGTATAHALGSRIAGDWVTFGRIRPIEERLAAYRAVSADDVRRVARTYLRDEVRNVLHLVAPPPGVPLAEPAPAAPAAPPETRQDPAPTPGDGR